MKKIFILILIFLTGCSNQVSIEEYNEENNNKIELIENLDFEYASSIYLHDLIKKSDVKIISENTLIDTSSLGEHDVTIKLKNGLSSKNVNIKYNVVDTTKPVLNLSNMTTYIGKEVNFLNNIMCGDNYDRNLKCEIIGEYDINKAGTYMLSVKATDSSNNINEKNFKLTVKEKSNNNNSSTPTYYYFNDLIKKYKTNKTMVGIDVSSWQGDINWEKVKNAGCEFAMIRIGFGHKDKELIFDSKFKANLENAKKAGIKVGLYFYSYAKTNDEAKEQAKWIIDALNGEKLDLPIAFDWEIWSGFNNYKLNFNDLNEIAESFIKEINKYNYEGIIYGSAFYINRVWNQNSRTWLAYYTSNNDFEKPYFMWQLSSQGKIDGINGYVDLNVIYLDK